MRIPMALLIAFSALSITLFACASNEDQPPASANDASQGEPGKTPVHKTAKIAKPMNRADAPTVKPAVVEQPGKDFLGAWHNGSCGKRKYARTITFFSDNRFEAADLVAPCPPNVRCVWSGIIDWRGTYELKDNRILLKTETPASERIDGGWPKSFSLLSDAEKRIAEESPEGLTCPYQRQK